MTFRDSHARLVEQVRKRLQNGEMTERSLARQLGISQSHVNNVLRGRRKLSHEIADLILNSFNFSILDLHVQSELESNLTGRSLPQTRRETPILRRPIGQGQPWSYVEEGYRCLFPLAASTVRECAVLARLQSDPRMQRTLSRADFALVDTSYSARFADCPSCLYVVSRGQDTLVRWVRSGAGKLYLPDEQTCNRPTEWEMVPMVEARRLETIKGCIIWLGAETAVRRA